MLNWIVIWVGVVPVRARRAAPERRRRRPLPISNDVVEGAKLHGLLGRPAAPGPPHRLLHRARRARRLLARSSTARRSATGSGGRLQPRGRPLRRHQRPAQLLPRDGDLRRVRRARGRDRHPRLAVPALDRATSRPRRSGSSGSRSRCSAATRRSGPASRRSSSARCSPGRRPGTSIPSIFQPELASNLTLLIQGLIVLFVGADLVILWLMARVRGQEGGRRDEPSRCPRPRHPEPAPQRSRGRASCSASLARLRRAAADLGALVASGASCSRSSPRCAGIFVLTRGERRFGWYAIAAGGCSGFGLGYLATALVDREARGRRRLVGALRRDAPLRDAAHLRRARRDVLRALAAS